MLMYSVGQSFMQVNIDQEIFLNNFLTCGIDIFFNQLSSFARDLMFYSMHMHILLF